MQFIDEAKIFIKSGNGGPGCVSFRREANVPLGGPDGGNGGRGGSVIIEGVAGLNTLIDFRYQQHFKAKSGMNGMGENRHGKSGDDLVIKVPVGTQIFDGEDPDIIIADIQEVGQQLRLVEGGDGGFGNTHYKSSVNQAPRKAQPGWPGSERWIWLKLKLLSDAGLVGLPNAGKSTFVAQVSRARPKIADYPFTTIKPQLGVVYVDNKEFVIADIPGLIAGAHAGVGLGDRFLKHVERCGVLLHLVDGTQEDVADAYTTIRGELEAYGHGLGDKTEILALNKIDALQDDEIAEKKAELEAVSGKEVMLISGVSGAGIVDAKRRLIKEISRFRGDEDSEEEEKEAGGYSPI